MPPTETPSSPSRRVRGDERASRLQTLAEFVGGVAIEVRFVRRWVDDDRADAAFAAREKVRPRARGHVSVSPSGVRWPSAPSMRRPNEDAGVARRARAVTTCPGSPTSRSVSTSPSQGTNVARTGKFVASAVSGEPTKT